MPFRVGGSLGTTIYYVVGDEESKQDVYLGIMDTPDLARMVVSHFNDSEKQTLLILGTDQPNAYYPFKAHIRKEVPPPLYPAHLLDDVAKRRQAKVTSLMRHPSRTGVVPDLPEECR